MFNIDTSKEYSNIDVRVKQEFIKEEYKQAVDTFRGILTLYVQIVTVAVVANVTILGIGFERQNAGIIFICFTIPIFMLFITYRVNKYMLPIVYSAFDLENKLLDDPSDMLMSSFVEVTLSADAVKKLREIQVENDYTTRMKKLKKSKIFLLSDRGIIRIIIILSTILYLLSPFILVYIFNWDFL